MPGTMKWKNLLWIATFVPLFLFSLANVPWREVLFYGTQICADLRRSFDCFFSKKDSKRNNLLSSPSGWLFRAFYFPFCLV